MILLTALFLLACTPEMPATGDSGSVDSTGMIDSETVTDTAPATDCLLYRDQDEDGWGTDSLTTHVCDTPGFVEENGDCDDQNATISPDGIEACNQLDDDCDGTVDEGDVDLATWYQDLDDDGYGTPTATAQSCSQPDGFAASDDDCHDSDASIHPYADELCDGVDQDCDDAVDEGPLDPPTWYFDGDGDGHGDAANTAQACEAPTDHVADATDCDDTDAAISPSAVEHCDDRDEDCDTLVDEDPSDSTTWHADTDGDGHGDAANTVDACDQPTTHVADDTDCDDADSSVNPSESEVCDSVDQDCDGHTDEGAQSTFYADSDGDGYGWPGTGVDACEAPTATSVNDDDCDDTDGAVSPAASETCDGVDQDCDGDTDEGLLSTFYWDDDGDGYGSTDKTTEDCSAPSGYTTSDSDCYDLSADAYPGQTDWFSVDRGDGSFDYDCDSVETGENESTSSCSLGSSPDGDGECEGDDGWYISPPACGDEWWWIGDCTAAEEWSTCYPDDWDWLALACR